MQWLNFGNGLHIKANKALSKCLLKRWRKSETAVQTQTAISLFAWIQDETNRAALLFDQDVNGDAVQNVLDRYADDLTDDEIEAIGRDPFLIAHALADVANRCVVTTEVSKPRMRRQNRRIPDVCTDLGVQCCDTFAMLKSLRFSTRWRA